MYDREWVDFRVDGRVYDRECVDLTSGWMGGCMPGKGCLNVRVDGRVPDRDGGDLDFRVDGRVPGRDGGILT